MKQIHGGDIYRNPDVLDFSSNVNPLGTPEGVICAAAESLKNAVHYPDVENTGLLRALSEYENVPEEYIIFGNGAADVIFSFVRAAAPKRALLPAPTFAEYGLALESTGTEIEYYMTEELCITDSFLLSLEGDISCAFICNPNNPTGFLTDKALLEKIIIKCRQKGIYLLLDECFLDFTQDALSYSMKGMLEESPGLFILNSFTKRYAMAGLRLGYGLCSDRAFLDRMEKMSQPWNISIVAQAAGEAALKETEYLKKAQKTVNEQRGYLKDNMKKLGLEVYDSKSNYVFFKGPEDLYDRCLEKKILIRDCSNYKGLRAGYFRVAVRKKEENDRLIAALSEIL